MASRLVTLGYLVLIAIYCLLPVFIYHHLPTSTLAVKFSFRLFLDYPPSRITRLLAFGNMRTLYPHTRVQRTHTHGRL